MLNIKLITQASLLILSLILIKETTAQYYPSNLCPCQNGGLCVTLPTGNYGCSCKNGYTGNICETVHQIVPVSPCAHNPCQYGGQCVPQHTSFSCICPPQYSGQTCNQPIAPAYPPPQVHQPQPPCCQPNPCNNGGLCVPAGPTFVCVCPSQYSGQTCNSYISAPALPAVPSCCQPNPCQNGGQCIPNGAAFACICPNQYSGQTCNSFIHAAPPPAVYAPSCQPNPCQNGGRCQPAGHSFNCQCPSLYSGHTCGSYISPLQPQYGPPAIPSGHCNPNPCNNGGQCVPAGTVFVCICPPGTSGQTCGSSFHGK